MFELFHNWTRKIKEKKGNWKLCVYMCVSLCCPVSWWTALWYNEVFLAFQQQALILVDAASLRVHFLAPKVTFLLPAGVLLVVSSLVLMFFYSSWQVWLPPPSSSLSFLHMASRIILLEWTSDVLRSFQWLLISLGIQSHNNLQTLWNLAPTSFSCLIPTFPCITVCLAPTWLFWCSSVSLARSCLTDFVLGTWNSCPQILVGPSLHSNLCFCGISSEILSWSPLQNRILPLYPIILLQFSLTITCMINICFLIYLLIACLLC